MDNPFSKAISSVGRSIGDALRSTPSDVVDLPYNTLKNALSQTGQWTKNAAPVAQKIYTGKAPKKQTTQDRVDESIGTTVSNLAGPVQVDTPTDPFTALNRLIPDPLTMQLFYNQTVAPLIQSQVKQMTDYGNLLKQTAGGAKGGLSGINQQLGNEYGALAAALGAQTAQAPAFDALLKNITDAKAQQTDIYSLIKSLISAQQQPTGDLASILALAGLGQG